MEQVISIVFTTDFAFGVLRLMTPILSHPLRPHCRSGVLRIWRLKGLCFSRFIWGDRFSLYAISMARLILAIAVAVLISLMLAFLYH